MGHPMYRAVTQELVAQQGGTIVAVLGPSSYVHSRAACRTAIGT